MEQIDWRSKVWAISLALLAVYVVALLPNAAFAQETIGRLMCGVAEWFTGRVGKGIATLAIIVVGLGALLGKVSWGMAIIVGIGIAVIFGASTIVSELDTEGGGGC